MLNRESGQKLEDKSRRYLDIIGNAARQMSGLIDDLLVFSRMGRTELRWSNVDPNELVKHSLETLHSEISGRNVIWHIDPLPNVQADPSMFQQVWSNLLNNAVKYSRTRDPAEIEIRCAAQTPEEFIFLVRDNGVGFDMKYANKLFGVFQRLHRSDEFEGTGIGLANVRRIVQRHGGRTWAEAELGTGATFYFTLPRQPSTSTG
jgi:light-regulated signal transduction histidine kinase (bacteriophytochrome)